MIYALVNLRSLKFVDYVDAFSYLFMSAFIVFWIFFTVFFIIYAKFTPIEKWSAKIREILNETNEKTRGILFYHLIFTFRRLILTINVILLGVFPANVHISIHAVSQLIVFLMFWFIPMYETRFQKVSNLIMESCNTFVFFSAYYFQNSDHSSVLSMIVMAYILLSQFAILILTFSKGIKDIVLWYQSKKKQVVSASSIMTEKSVMGKVIEDASPNYCSLENPAPGEGRVFLREKNFNQPHPLFHTYNINYFVLKNI